MGFSVSGATALLLIAFLISFGAFYTATNSSFDKVREAEDVEDDRTVDSLNTEIDVNSSYDASDDQLVINATNEGATALRLNDTDLLVDGEFVDGWEEGAEVAGDADRFVWHPQEELGITIDRQTAPTRIKLVTQHRVATTAGVEDDVENLQLSLDPDTASTASDHNWSWDSVDIDCSEDSRCLNNITLSYEDISLDGNLIDTSDINYTVEGKTNVGINSVSVDGNSLLIDVSGSETTDPSNGFSLNVTGSDGGIVNPAAGEYEATITFEADTGFISSPDTAFGRTTYQVT